MSTRIRAGQIGPAQCSEANQSVIEGPGRSGHNYGTAIGLPVLTTSKSMKAKAVLMHADRQADFSTVCRHALEAFDSLQIERIARVSGSLSLWSER